jgi:hypothetical protein
MRVMVFLHGTAIMHAAAADRTQAERVRQSSQRDPSVTKAVSAAGESYADVARRSGADVVVEDDCGDGPREMGDRPAYRTAETWRFR